MNDSESVVGYGRNVAVVIPHVPSSSFVEPVVNVENYNLLGTGDISVDIMAKNLIKDKIYQLIFKNDTLFSNNNAHLPLMIVTNGFEVSSKIVDTDSLELVYLFLIPI